MTHAVGITYSEHLVRQAERDVRCTGHVSLYITHQLTLAGLDADVIERRIIKQLAEEA